MRKFWHIFRHAWTNWTVVDTHPMFGRQQRTCKVCGYIQRKYL
jgi:prephenate dehydrogenase